MAEAVDREDRRVVERGDRGAQPLARRIVELPRVGAGRRGVLRGAREPVEQVADAEPQLGDRLVGERDQQDLAEVRAREHEVDDAVLEEERLAGPRRGLDDDEAIVGRGQRVRASDEHRAHSSPPSLTSPDIRSASGASRRSASSTRSGGSSSP